MMATFSKDVTGFDLTDITVVGGVAGNFTATSATVYTFDITVSAGAITVDLAAAAAQDGAGNQSTAAPQFAITYDNTPPTVTGVTSTLANGSYGLASIVPIEVTFSEAVTITGTPQITLNSGAPAVNYTSGSSSTASTSTCQQTGRTSDTV